MESLRVWRKTMGLSMREARERVSPTRNDTMIPHPQWARAERRFVFPNHTALSRYCAALGIEYDQLFGVQSIIEENFRNDPEFKLDEHVEEMIEEYAKRRKLPTYAVVPTRPGAVFFTNPV